MNKIINYTEHYQEPNEFISALWKQYGQVDKYSHYITIQLPRYRRKSDLERAKKEWRKIIADVERNLMPQNKQRHWYKYQIPFIGCAAIGTNGYWHYHLLLEKSENLLGIDVFKAIWKTQRKFGLTNYNLHVESIGETMKDIQNVLGYTGSHIRVTRKNHLDPLQFIMSGELLEKRD